MSLLSYSFTSLPLSLTISAPGLLSHKGSALRGVTLSTLTCKLAKLFLPFARLCSTIQAQLSGPHSFHSPISTTALTLPLAQLCSTIKVSLLSYPFTFNPSLSLTISAPGLLCTPEGHLSSTTLSPPHFPPLSLFLADDGMAFAEINLHGSPSGTTFISLPNNFNNNLQLALIYWHHIFDQDHRACDNLHAQSWQPQFTGGHNGHLILGTSSQGCLDQLSNFFHLLVSFVFLFGASSSFRWSRSSLSLASLALLTGAGLA